MTRSTEQVIRRGILSGAVALVSTFLAFHAQAAVIQNTDFAQIWHAARGMAEGRNPYEVVGPQGTFRWPFPLLYPGTAILASLPLSWLSIRLASATFVGLGSGALTWVLAGRPACHAGAWWLFASASYVYVIRTAQWAPLLMTAALTPSAGWLLACKPSTGLALFVAYPTWRAVATGAAFLVLSIAILPTWPLDWLRALPSAYHMSAPVTYVTAGGPLILLGLLRWRRPEARLVVALGCIPHTTMLYEALPLFLVARRWQEGLLLAIGSWACMFQHVLPDYLQMMHTMAWRMTVFLYLPCVAMLMLRENRRPSLDTRDVLAVASHGWLAGPVSNTITATPGPRT